MSEEKFTDKSLMPFGMYKGREIANVPDSYLLYLHESQGGIKHRQLREYVLENLDSIINNASNETHHRK